MCGLCTFHLGRRTLFSALIGGIALSSHAASAQWGMRPVNFGAAPDGGARIPEFLVPGSGGLGGFAGFATLTPFGPVILYDASWVQRLGGSGSPAMRFTRAHEYGHHRRGHTLAYITSPPGTLPYLNYESELDADCWAVQILDDDDDEEAIRAAVRMYERVLPQQDTGGRPGAFRRIQNIRACVS